MSASNSPGRAPVAMWWQVFVGVVLRARNLIVAAVFIVCAFGVAAGIPGSSLTASATTVTITDPVDQVVSNALCSLREAIQAVNTGLPVDTCPAGTGSDVIIIPSGTYELESHLTITQPVTIRGANAGIDGRLNTRGPETVVRLAANPTPGAMFSLTGDGGASVFDGLSLQGSIGAAELPVDPLLPAQSVVGITFYDATGIPRGFTATNSIFADFTYAMYASGTEQTVTHNDFRGELSSPIPAIQNQLQGSGAYGKGLFH